VNPASQFRIWLGLLVALLALLYFLGGVLLPFVAGMAIAYLLDPLASALVRRGLSRGAAAALILAAFFAAVLVVLSVGIPLLQREIVDLAHRLPELAARLREVLTPIIERIVDRFDPDVLHRIAQDIQSAAGSAVRSAIGAAAGLISGGLALVSLLSLLVITPVVAFYLLRDWPDMLRRIDHWLPRAHAATIREQLGLIDQMISGFVRGQAMVCISLGLFYGIALVLVGLQFGLVIGLLTGLFSFIPFVGAFTGSMIALVVAFAQFGDLTGVAKIVGILMVGQILEGYVLTPKLVGDRVGLHPVWVMFALLAGGALFGFVGILLAVPGAAAIGVLVRFALARYLESPLYGPRA
jgi:predicted PurR-regulated permease PerM